MKKLILLTVFLLASSNTCLADAGSCAGFNQGIACDASCDSDCSLKSFVDGNEVRCYCLPDTGEGMAENPEPAADE